MSFYGIQLIKTFSQLLYFIFRTTLGDSKAGKSHFTEEIKTEKCEAVVQSLIVHDGSCSDPTILGDADQAGFFITSCLHALEIWWGH